MLFFWVTVSFSTLLRSAAPGCWGRVGVGVGLAGVADHTDHHVLSAPRPSPRSQEKREETTFISFSSHSGQKSKAMRSSIGPGRGDSVRGHVPPAGRPQATPRPPPGRPQGHPQDTSKPPPLRLCVAPCPGLPCGLTEQYASWTRIRTRQVYLSYSLAPLLSRTASI